MSADLSRARQERGEVLRVERLGLLVELTARLPHLAAATRPGEFAQLRCADASLPLLRRPFSVAHTESDTCSFVLREVGAGTRALAALHPGDSLDALGPLGRGFTLPGAGPAALCVSGGVGCAPFPLLVRALRGAGVSDITVMNGAATAAALYPAERFQRGDGGVRVLEASDDGSRGVRGPVTELLRRHSPAPGTALYACGPNAMLAAVAALLDELPAHHGVREASLEAPMGCGFGTCLGCALPLHEGADAPRWALCCTEGPVLPLQAVAWDDLLRLPGAGVAA